MSIISQAAARSAVAAGRQVANQWPAVATATRGVCAAVHHHNGADMGGEGLQWGAFGGQAHHNNSASGITVTALPHPNELCVGLDWAFVASSRQQPHTTSRPTAISVTAIPEPNELCMGLDWAFARRQQPLSVLAQAAAASVASAAKPELVLGLDWAFSRRH